MKKILLTTLLVLLSCTALVAQEEEYPSGVLISTRPQTLFFGADLGVEVPLNSNWSIGAEAIAHVWRGYIPKNIALKPSVKWYFWGTTGRGLYLRASGVGGYFLGEPRRGYRNYAGGGVGIGFQGPFSRGSRWHFIYDVGLKLCMPFGKVSTSMSDTNDMMEDMTPVYLIFLSPASFVDLSIGIAYRFSGTRLVL